MDFKVEKLGNGIVLYCYKSDLFQIENDLVEKGRTEIRKDKTDGLLQTKLGKDYEIGVTYEKWSDWLYYNYYNPIKDYKKEDIEKIDNILNIYNKLCSSK